ncbi:hypothetical protein SAMN05216184_1342, partial [Georgenia satyanarayanai]
HDGRRTSRRQDHIWHQKLGTLLSSQETDTHRRTRRTRRRPGPGQLLKITRTVPPCQLALPGPEPSDIPTSGHDARPLASVWTHHPRDRPPSLSAWRPCLPGGQRGETLRGRWSRVKPSAQHPPFVPAWALTCTFAAGDASRSARRQNIGAVRSFTPRSPAVRARQPHHAAPRARALVEDPRQRRNDGGHGSRAGRAVGRRHRARRPPHTAAPRRGQCSRTYAPGGRRSRTQPVARPPWRPCDECESAGGPVRSQARSYLTSRTPGYGVAVDTDSSRGRHGRPAGCSSS